MMKLILLFTTLAHTISHAEATVLQTSAPLLDLCPAPPIPITDTSPTLAPVLYGDPNDCHLYIQCNHGTPLLRHCNPNTVFSNVYRTCVQEGSFFDTCPEDRISTTTTTTTANPTLLAHPSACQRYFNYSDMSTRPPNSLFLPFEQECTYPDLFDVDLMECRSYTVANCGGRIPGLDPCTYLQNQCMPLSVCTACFLRLPGCVNLADGFHPFPLRPRRFYIECRDERLVNTLVCPGIFEIFDPQSKTCTGIL